MKKLTKVCLILCIIFGGFGVVCLGLGVAMGSGLKEVETMFRNGEFDIMFPDDEYDDFEDTEDGIDTDDIVELMTEEPEEDDSEGTNLIVDKKFDADDIDKLNIDIKYGEVKVVENSGNDITIEASGSRRVKYKCKVEGDTLEIHDVSKYPKHTSHHVRITIGIPKDAEFDEIDFETNAGDVEVDAALCADKVKLEVDAGQLVAKQLIAADTLKVEVGAGSMKIEKMEVRKADANCGVGEMVLSGSIEEKAKSECGMGSMEFYLDGDESDFDYEMECGLGEIQLNDQVYSSFGGSKDIDYDADKKFEIQCGMGSIKIENQ